LRAGFHIAVETVLLVTILLLLLQRSFKPQKKPLTEEVRAVAQPCVVVFVYEPHEGGHAEA